MTQSVYSIDTEDLDIDTFDGDSQFEMTSPDMLPQIPDYLRDSDEGPKMKPLAKAEDAETKLLSINSLLPLLKFLPGLVLKNSVYHINGSISKEDGDALIQYAQRIGEFSLCDQNTFLDQVSDAKAEPEGRIGLDVIIRLIKLQSLCTQTNTLFPSLKRLHIDNAKSAMDYLDLFVTPSLEAIEITGVSEDHFDAFYSFFTTLADEVPGLNSLILGPGPMPSTVMEMSITFRHLQRLEFVNISTSFDFDFLENIGRLESLQSLTVDMGDSDGGLYMSRASALGRMRIEQEKIEEEARQKEMEDAAASLRKKREEEALKAAQEARIRELEEQLRWVQKPLSRPPSPKPHDDGVMEDSWSKPPSSMFGNKPHEAFASTDTYSFGSPLSANSNAFDWGGSPHSAFTSNPPASKPPASKPTSKPATKPPTTKAATKGPAKVANSPASAINAPAAKGSKEGGKKKCNLTPSPNSPVQPPNSPVQPLNSPVQPPIPKVRSPSPSVWSRASSPFLPGSDINATSSKTYDAVASGNLFCALKVLVIRGSQVLVEELVSTISSRTLQSMSITFSTYAPASPWSHSADEVAAIISSIAEARWRNTLSTLSLRLLESKSVFDHLNRSGGLPGASFKNLLCMPNLEHLDLSGMPLLSIESGFNHLSKGMMALKTLFLPDDATAPGISIARLQVLAVACPDLVSLRCKLKHLSNIPEIRDLSPIPLSHTLETLSIGNADPHPDPQRVLDIARYLDFLFPQLKAIETLSGQNESQWMSIFSMLKVCQAVRSDERKRLGVGIHE